MKSRILNTILCCVSVAGTFSPAQAQVKSSCKIAYTYDVAGNRVKRAYRCDPPANPNGPADQQPGDVTATVSPNPTQGPITGYFSEPVSGGSVELNTMSGERLLVTQINGPTRSFTLDLSPYAPGSYVVTIRVQGFVESHTIIKM